MTIEQQTTFTCDSCGAKTENPPENWWALGRYAANGQFVCSKHICGQCYARVFDYKVAAEMRVQ